MDAQNDEVGTCADGGTTRRRSFLPGRRHRSNTSQPSQHSCCWGSDVEAGLTQLSTGPWFLQVDLSARYRRWGAAPAGRADVT